MAQYANRFTSVPVSSVPANIAAEGNLLVKTGPGVLASVNVNTGVATSTVTLYDGTDNTGTKIGVVDASTRGQILYNVAFTKGLFAVMAAANSDVTIGYR